LDQLTQLSRQMKMNFQPAKRQAGAAIIVPSVVHWKSGHYAAILEKTGDSYFVKDPTFQSEAILSKAAIEDEASGYFLVPQGTLPTGWTSVEKDEANGVWGRGFPATRSAGCTKCKDKSAGGCSSCSATPMTDYTIKLLLACLHLGDTPVGYTPPVGPSVYFAVGYNQYEYQSYTSFYSNLGTDWVSNWVGYIPPITLPSAPSYSYSSFNVVLPSGGFETYTSSSNPYTSTSSTTGYYGPQVQGQTVLYVMQSSAHSGQLRYENHMPDGSMEVFDSVADSSGNIYLSQIVDPQGNAITFGYDTTQNPVGTGPSYLRLISITDAINQTTNIYYDLSDTLKITRVTDPFGRTATFNYTVIGGAYQLTSITDIMGMTSSYTYGSTTDNAAITAMVTPYGTTTFSTASNSDSSDRTLLITDPNGGQEKAYALYEPDTSIDPPLTEPLPSNFFVDNNSDGTNDLSKMDTYYWDKRAMLLAPNDFTKSHVYHFLRSDDFTSVSPVLYNEKKALESRVWYYYGQSSGSYNALGSSDEPTGVVRLLDDGSSQYYQYSYNTMGNMIHSIDPIGRTLTYDYASNNIDLIDVRQTKGSNNDGLLKITYASTPPHCPQDVYDGSGQETQYAYNSQGQVTSVTNPKGEVTTYTYTGPNGSGSGNYLTSLVGPAPDGNGWIAVSGTYDAYGRLAQVTDSQGYTYASRIAPS
jgi:YD repeat-containing protein